MMTIMRSLLKRWHKFWLRLLSLETSPKQLARGLAVGVFAGFFPLFGFQTIIGVFLAILFSGNKIAATAATWVSNPFTYIPIYWFNYQVGSLLLGGDKLDPLVVTGKTWQEVLEVLLERSYILFFGCLVVGLIAAIATYFISLHFILSRQD